MNAFHLFPLRVLAAVMMVLSAADMFAETYEFPILGAERVYHCDNNREEKLEDSYFAIDVLTDVHGQEDCITFRLMPDPESGVMSDHIWFDKSSSCYLPIHNGFRLASNNFPDIGVKIEGYDNIGGYMGYVEFMYYDDKGNVSSSDTVYLDFENFYLLWDLVEKQIQQLGIPEA